MRDTVKILMISF